MPDTETSMAAVMSNARAVRYRRLALQEADSDKAKLLQSLAEEAERGVLCTAEWLQPKPHAESPLAVPKA